ncbi:MAG: HD domain-containing protein [Bifidobacteriaceae bacterium]|nr:HD domain-containing protein [Bifidobacteriaceae bacterium]
MRDLGAARAGEGPLAAQWWGLGRAGREARTELAKQALAALWAQAMDAVGAPGGGAEGITLGAVGSLGRGDLGPLSDLDLVVVYNDSFWDESTREALARALWYPLWDLGFDLDQSMRSLAECRKIASQDVPAATGLLSLRYLAGDEDLAGRAASAVLTDWRSAARRRLTELAESVVEREDKFGDLAYRLEPDLKEARGGLRDAVTLQAVVATWLADRPHGDVDAAWDYVLDVRDALHTTTRRSTHQLVMADHDATAALVAQSSPPGATKQARDADFMLSGLAAAGRTVTYALDTTLRRAIGALPTRKILPPVFVRGERRPPRLTPIVQGIGELNGELVFNGAPQTDPVLPLRAARAAATTGLPLEPLTAIQLATRCPALPDPWPAEAREELAGFLGAGRAIVDVWEALDQAGVILRLWPEWQPVRNQIQRNPLHRHTVDRHQVEAVAELASIQVGQANRELVQTAALFHDLGKRPLERDHPGYGARLAGPLFERLGYPAADVAYMVALVRHHLTLADLATTRDVADPATAEALVVALDGSRTLIDGLEALTEADARAAGPKAWTTWRASLVHALAAAARQFLA